MAYNFDIKKNIVNNLIALLCQVQYIQSKVNDIDRLPHPKNSLEASDYRKMTVLKYLAVTQSD